MDHMRINFLGLYMPYLSDALATAISMFYMYYIVHA